jgi:hypothetical protein
MVVIYLLRYKTQIREERGDKNAKKNGRTHV